MYGVAKMLVNHKIRLQRAVLLLFSSFRSLAACLLSKATWITERQTAADIIFKGKLMPVSHFNV